MDGSSSRLGGFVRWFLIVLLVVAGSVTVNLVMGHPTPNTPTTNTTPAETTVTKSPLDDVFNVQGTAQKTVTLDAGLVLNNTVVFSPQTQPVAAVAGQMYFDGATHELNYYNGTQFVALSGATGGDSTTIVNSTSSGSDISLPLTVAQGGTGATSLTGVVVGGGTGAFVAVAPSATGQCLTSTASGPSFTACPGLDGSTAFLQNGNSFGATAVIGTNDPNGLQFEVNNGTIATISATGATSFQNASNSASAFAVLNALGTSQLVVDTTNSRVYVGSVAVDSTGTLLVLDRKNTAGDPTGLAGAMYYNSNIDQFRCYEATYWRDCNVPSARTSSYFVSDFYGFGAGSDMTFDSVGGGGMATKSAVAGHPGIVYMDTGAGTASRMWILPRTTGGKGVVLFGGGYWRQETVARLPSTSALSDGTDPYTFRSGFIDDASQNSGDGVDGCFLRYTHSTNSGKWQGVCRNNSVESTCDTGVTVALGTWYRLTVMVNAAGTATDFQVNGAGNCQVAANIPTATGRETNWGIVLKKDGSGTASRVADIDYMEVQSQLTTPR